ncbi:unnamed protein product, partial [Pocillopora meandrina]
MCGKILLTWHRKTSYRDLSPATRLAKWHCREGTGATFHFRGVSLRAASTGEVTPGISRRTHTWLYRMQKGPHNRGIQTNQQAVCETEEMLGKGLSAIHLRPFKETKVN